VRGLVSSSSDPEQSHVTIKTLEGDIGILDLERKGDIVDLLRRHRPDVHLDDFV
jgi:hypothetical protein